MERSKSYGYCNSIRNHPEKNNRSALITKGLWFITSKSKWTFFSTTKKTPTGFSNVCRFNNDSTRRYRFRLSALLVGQHSIKFVGSSDIGGTALGGGAVIRHAEVQGFIAFRSCCNLMHIHHACHPRLVGWLVVKLIFPQSKIGWFYEASAWRWVATKWMDGWKFRSVA